MQQLLLVVSLTVLSLVLLIIEKVVCKQLTAMLSDSTDPLQPSYQANTGAEEAFTTSPVRQTLVEPLLEVN